MGILVFGSMLVAVPSWIIAIIILLIKRRYHTLLINAGLCFFISCAIFLFRVSEGGGEKIIAIFFSWVIAAGWGALLAGYSVSVNRKENIRK